MFPPARRFEDACSIRCGRVTRDREPFWQTSARLLVPSDAAAVLCVFSRQIKPVVDTQYARLIRKTGSTSAQMTCPNSSPLWTQPARTPAKNGGGGELVFMDVSAFLDYYLLPGFGCELNRDLIGHAPCRRPKRAASFSNISAACSCSRLIVGSSSRKRRHPHLPTPSPSGRVSSEGFVTVSERRSIIVQNDNRRFTRVDKVDPTKVKKEKVTTDKDRFTFDLSLSTYFGGFHFRSSTVISAFRMLGTHFRGSRRMALRASGRSRMLVRTSAMPHRRPTLQFFFGEFPAVHVESVGFWSRIRIKSGAATLFGLSSPNQNPKLITSCE